MRENAFSVAARRPSKFSADDRRCFLQASALAAASALEIGQGQAAGMPATLYFLAAAMPIFATHTA